MGNLAEKFGLMLRNLGTKIANNYGAASDTYVPICNGISGAANSQLTPKGAMSLAELSTVLGGEPSMFVTANDANQITTPGFYQNSNWVSNTPQSSGILIMPYYYTGYWKFQMFCDNISNHMWFRSGTSSSYSAWKQIV